MVGVAQSVELQTVDLAVVGSNPITHPNLPIAERARSSMDRASDFGSDGWGFDSLRARHSFRTGPKARVLGYRPFGADSVTGR